MNLDELQSVQSRERQTDQLQQLRATFYEEAGQFVQQLREERDRAAERADDPFDSPEVNRLTDDIKTAEQTVEAVYERRVGKIVKMASLAAADMPTEEDGLTQEERDLFETMVGAIESNRSHVLDVIAGEAPAGAVGDGTSEAATADASSADDPARAGEPTAESTTPADQPESGVGAADVMGGTDDPTPPSPPEDASKPPQESDTDAARPPGEGAAAVDGRQPANSSGDDGPASDATVGDRPSATQPGQRTEATDIDRRTVRITEDVGEIFGVDQREYDLSTDDVVTLPADNADPLVEQDAAEPLE